MTIASYGRGSESGPPVLSDLPSRDRRKRRSTRLSLLLLCCLTATAQTKRVVILKVDGLPEGLVERYAAENAGGFRDGQTRLPFIHRIFGDHGTWLDSFYVRGMSLSAPSWSMLDTGHHLEIHGNAEYDRYTLRSHDYLNFFPLYRAYAENKRADMAGVELLDEQGVPLLIDRFPVDARYQGFQLFQRGVRWKTLSEAIHNKLRSPLKELFDEWQTGFSFTSSVNEQQERELIAKLKDPTIRYLDYYTGDYDHVAHLAEDALAQLRVIESIDALVGRVWAAIAQSPYADSTALILVSDHGMNTTEGTFSQGYSLVDFFTSSAGGAHHVINNRHIMSEYKIKGLDPFVAEVTTASTDSTYLAGRSGDYPTAVLDLDGNERANISLRNNSLNILHILLLELIKKQIRGPAREAAIDALFQTLDRERPVWGANIDALADELRDLRLRIKADEKRAAELRHPTRQQIADGLRTERWRLLNRAEQAKADEHAYLEYIATMRRLLALNPADFDPGKFKIEELIPRKSLGELNSIHDLRHYVAGPAPTGLVVAPDGSLDMEKSFSTIDYFTALTSLQVRNKVQKDVGPRPVDFIAVAAAPDKVWLFRDADHQVFIEKRGEQLRYTPVSNWCEGLPLEIFEDPFLDVPDHESWLREWHSESEWLQAVHRTRYSNGIIGIVEQLLNEVPPGDPYRDRRRALRRTDLLVFSNDHWNFNVRGFNPGGNHGSLLEISTHSVLMFAGGKYTGIPRGLHVKTPYDSLSLVPTILTLLGTPDPTLPGPVIKELLAP
ncbi:MAG TPA: alkaline phosphatase family protein [Bryobacteraceae bacterium]|nr:alkaline phosphatase family protein [Bryobacteraceae bacterium]